MEQRNLVVLDPTVAPKVVEQEMAQRLEELDGKVIGILWNGKANGEILLGRMEEVLKQRYEFAGVVKERKRAVSIPAYEGTLDHLAGKCDAVINAIGD